MPMTMQTRNDINAFIDAIQLDSFRYSRAASWRADGYVAGQEDYIVTTYHMVDDGIVANAHLHDYELASLLLRRAGRGIPQPARS